jgi:hypothetical protein
MYFILESWITIGKFISKNKKTMGINASSILKPTPNTKNGVIKEKIATYPTHWKIFFVTILEKYIFIQGN